MLFIITFISIIIYGLLSEINWMDGWTDGWITDIIYDQVLLHTVAITLLISQQFCRTYSEYAQNNLYVSDR